MVRDAPILRPPAIRVGPHRPRFAVLVGALAGVGTAAALAGLLRALLQDRPVTAPLLGLSVSVGVALLAWTLRPRSAGARASLVADRTAGTSRWALEFPFDPGRPLAAMGGLLAWAAVPAAIGVAALREGVVPGVVGGAIGTALLAGIPVLGVCTGSLRRTAVLLTAAGVVLRRGTERGEIAWDRILEARPVEHRQRHTVVPFVGLRVRDPGTLDQEAPVLRSSVAAARGLGVDIAIRTGAMVVDPDVLGAAIEHYRRHPQDREALPDHRWPPGPAPAGTGTYRHAADG